MVTYFVDDKLGGVTSLNYNLVTNTGDFCIDQQVVHLDLVESNFTRSAMNFPANKNLRFRFSKKDNYYHTLNRLSNLVDLDSPGALVLNYYTEMALLDHFPTLQTTYQLVHDDYNVGLAGKYGHLVDVFICHNTDIFGKLRSLFPHRTDNIFYRPHGVPVFDFMRNQAGDEDVIKLLFLGRMTDTKGIFDLPKINELLRQQGVKFEWVCIGNGPQIDDLKRAWNPLDKVEFLSPISNSEVISVCAKSDVFVLPTRFEGSPVSLLETMSVGLVPVISKLPGGITDIVNPAIGFAVPVEENTSFAKAIATLFFDRNLLNTLSLNCRSKIIEEFDVRLTAVKYHELFSRYREFYRQKKPSRMKVGSRLDHPFIPSFITRGVRSISDVIGR